MMHNSTRSGSLRDNALERKAPNVREADRTGKAGDAVKDRSFTIQPKTAVIEIRAGKVAVRTGK
jgi:hypothetical protein